MRFTLLLVLLGHLLKIASFTHGKFKRHIRKTRAVICIKTADNIRGRVFVFSKGKFSAHSNIRENFDAALVFSDASAGFKVLTSRKKDASFMAAATGQLKVEGTGFFAQWFEQGTKLILG